MELAFDAAWPGSLGAFAVGAGSLAEVVVGFAGALAGGLALACATSAAIARCASVAAAAGEPDGEGPSAAPARIPTASTQAASTPTTPRDGALPGVPHPPNAPHSPHRPDDWDPPEDVWALCACAASRSTLALCASRPPDRSPVGDNAVQNAVKSRRGLPRLAPHCRQ